MSFSRNPLSHGCSNFDRPAALKCRQRKKKWLQDLQGKVEFLTTENERLTNALITSREEIARLSQMVVNQGGAPSSLANNPPEIQNSQNHMMHSQPVSMSVSLPSVSKSIAAPVPLPSGINHHSAHQSQPMPTAITTGRGYGY